MLHSFSLINLSNLIVQTTTKLYTYISCFSQNLSSCKIFNLCDTLSLKLQSHSEANDANETQLTSHLICTTNEILKSSTVYNSFNNLSYKLRLYNFYNAGNIFLGNLKTIFVCFGIIDIRPSSPHWPKNIMPTSCQHNYNLAPKKTDCCILEAVAQ